jgi:hypothetical protein
MAWGQRTIPARSGRPQGAQAGQSPPRTRGQACCALGRLLCVTGLPISPRPWLAELTVPTDRVAWPKSSQPPNERNACMSALPVPSRYAYSCGPGLPVTISVASDVASFGRVRSRPIGRLWRPAGTGSLPPQIHAGRPERTLRHHAGTLQCRAPGRTCISPSH